MNNRINFFNNNYCIGLLETLLINSYSHNENKEATRHEEAYHLLQTKK